MKTLNLLTALALLALALPAQSQHLRGNPDALPPLVVWNLNIGQQLEQSLTSPVEEIRLIALQQVTYFARFHPDLDLRETVPALVTIYRTDPSAQNRTATIGALHALGDEGGLQQLRLHIVQQTRPVQFLTLAALLDHYGPDTFTDSPDMARLAEELIVHFQDQRAAAGRITGN